MNIQFHPFKRPLWPVVVEKLGIRWVEDTKGIIAIDTDSNDILAGCVMNNWTHSAVQVHFWIDKPVVIRRGFFNQIANYVFNTCGRDLMIGMVVGDNEEALKLDKHIGFKEKYRIKGGYMHDLDYVILEARREDLARWLPQEVEDGQERRARSA